MREPRLEIKLVHTAQLLIDPAMRKRKINGVRLVKYRHCCAFLGELEPRTLRVEGLGCQPTLEGGGG
jgi:hypothetical protein